MINDETHCPWANFSNVVADFNKHNYITSFLFPRFPCDDWEKIYIRFLIIIIKSEVWTITHCLGLGHDTMVCAVCLFILKGVKWLSVEYHENFQTFRWFSNILTRGFRSMFGRGLSRGGGREGGWITSLLSFYPFMSKIQIQSNFARGLDVA